MSLSSAGGPARQPFPDHLPRERIVVTAPEGCACCGSVKLVKLGEDVTEDAGTYPASVAGDPDGAGALLSSQECCIQNCALYVYHRAALASLLQAWADAVIAAGLPSTQITS